MIGGGGAFVAGSVIGYLKLDKKQWDASIKVAGKNLGGLAKVAGTVGPKLTRSLTVPLAAIGAASVSAFAKFDDAMNQSIAIMGDVSDAMREDMKNAAIEMSEQTTFSARDAAASYYYLASAGLDAEQSIAALPKVAKFAQAGMFDMSTATDLLTDAQSALGLTVDDTAQNMENMALVSDVLVKANTLANASVQQFSEALTNRAAAALKTVNKDVEEGVSVLAAFADAGMKGQMAGQQLAIIMTNLETAARKNDDAFKEYNVSVYDGNDNMRHMADIVGDLENALEGQTDKQKAAILAQMGFNDRARKSMMTLIGTSEKIRDYDSALRDAAGTTEEISDKQLESFSSQLELLKNEFVNIGMEVGEELVPILKELMDDVIRPAIGWFKDLTDGQKKTIVQVGLLVGAVGPLLTVFGKMLILIPKNIKGIAKLGKTAWASKAMIGKIGAVGAAAFVGWKVGRLIGELTGFDKVVQNVTASILGLDTSLENIKEEQKAWAEEARAGSIRTEALTEASKLAGKEITNLKDAYTILKNEGSATAAKIQEHLDVTKLLTEEEKKNRQEKEKLNKKQKESNKLLDDGSKIVDDLFNPALSDATDETISLKDELNLTFKSDLEQKIDNIRTALELYGDKLPTDDVIRLNDELNKTKERLGLIADTSIPAGRNLRVAFEGEALPAARNLNDVLDQAPDKMEDLEYQTQTSTSQMSGFFDGVFNDIARGWSNTIQTWMEGDVTFKNFREQLWEDMKSSFFGVIGQMLAKWSTDFIGGLLDSAKSAGGDIVSSLFGGGGGGSGGGGGGGLLSGLLGGGASAGGIWTGIGAAAGNLLGTLITGGKQKGAIDATNRELHNIWIEARHIFQDQAHILTGMDMIKWPIANNMKFLPYIKDNTGNILKTNWNRAKQMRDLISANNQISKILTSKKGAQGGAVITSPDFTFVHGTASQPEYIIPHRLMDAVGNRGKKVEQNISIPVTVNLNGTMISDSDYVNNRLLPEIMNGLNNDTVKQNLQRILGIPELGV